MKWTITKNKTHKLLREREMLNIRFKEKTNAWPGFVDLFSNLVIILIFLLIVFVFLWTTTNVFNKDTSANKIAALERIQKFQAEQIVKIKADKQETEQQLLTAKNILENQEAKITDQQMEQQNLANAYEQQLAELTTMLVQANTAKEEMARMESERHELQDQMSEQIAKSNNRISELNEQVLELQSALDKAEASSRQRDVEYVEMSQKLNKALADKVAELSALSEYQSEFYKQIKIALGDRTTVKQDGDRFIVSSDILFPSGSYTVSLDGQNQLRLLANVIKDFENKIPTNIDWIIRVDGHTDNKPVMPGTVGYKNNMQLSLLRATAVVNELVKNGVSKRRLVPSGFGELHPVALGNDTNSLQKNRRIELQLTNK